jgi:hypothetical protein
MFTHGFRRTLGIGWQARQVIPPFGGALLFDLAFGFNQDQTLPSAPWSETRQPVRSINALAPARFPAPVILLNYFRHTDRTIRIFVFPNGLKDDFDFSVQDRMILFQRANVIGTLLANLLDGLFLRVERIDCDETTFALA